MRVVLRRATRAFHTAPLRQLDRQIQDVVPGDLAATLEAHRESNLRARLRRLPARKGGFAFSREAIPERKTAQAGKALAQRIYAADTASQQLHSSEHDAQQTTLDGEPSAAPSLRLVRSRERRQTEDLDKALGYGCYVPPLSYRDRERYAPYLEDVLSLPIDGRDKLDQLLHECEHHFQLSEKETLARKSLASDIITQLKVRDPDADFHIFGSMALGLATPLSDIDICFSRPPQDDSQSNQSRRKDIRRQLRRMWRSLAKVPSLRDRQLINDARVPVLAFRHNASNVNFHVATGLPPTSQISLINGWLDELPHLRPLYFIVKTALDVRHLSDPAAGGLGSYTLTCMLVAYLRLAQKDDTDDLASALCEFLDFYAHFNTSLLGLSIAPPTVFQKRPTGRSDSSDTADQPERHEVHRISLAHPTQPWRLCLQDPNDPANDLGKNCSRIMDIRMTFRVLSKRLRYWLHATPERQLGDPLRPFFGKMLGLLRDERQMLLRYSKKSQHQQQQLSAFSGRMQREASPAYVHDKKTSEAGSSAVSDID